MKITIPITPLFEEKEITFPISFKTGNRYYHFWSETHGINVWRGHFEEIHILKYFEGFDKESIICEKSAVDKVFCEIRDKATLTLFPVDATDHNLPSEELEKFKSEANYKTDMRHFPTTKETNEILSQGK